MNIGDKITYKGFEWIVLDMEGDAVIKISFDPEETGKADQNSAQHPSQPYYDFPFCHNIISSFLSCGLCVIAKKDTHRMSLVGEIRTPPSRKARAQKEFGKPNSFTKFFRLSFSASKKGV